MTTENKFVEWTAVKAVGDYELDVTCIPFGSRDADNQYFDAETDIMDEQFQTPVIAYQHGVSQGGKTLQGKPVIVGKAVKGSLEKKSDGWHIRIVLDKALKVVEDIWNAAKNGFAAVSSGSIDHLARLEVKEKLLPYSKNTPGRIAVWPLAEISIWEKGAGNFKPANNFAIAVPAMKAIYKEAGVPFPSNIEKPETDKDPVADKKKIEIQKKAQDYLKYSQYKEK